MTELSSRRRRQYCRQSYPHDQHGLRHAFWLDMSDCSVVLAMTQGIGAALTNDEKRAHLADIGGERLIDQVCVQEILPPSAEGVMKQANNP